MGLQSRMQSGYSIFEAQLDETCKRYPHLHIKETSGRKFLRGTLDIKDSDGRVVQSFFVEIHYQQGFPFRFPRMFEIGGYIPDGADWHKYADGSCCITAEPIEIIECANGISVIEFIDKYAIPYFAHQVYRKEFGEYQKEYAHGAKGLRQAYRDIMGTDNVLCWWEYARIAFGYRSLRLKRKDNCPCGSGRKYKHCHMKIFENLKKIGEEKFIEHISQLNMQ